MDTCFEPEKDKAAKGGEGGRVSSLSLCRYSGSLMLYVFVLFFCLALRMGIVCENTCTVSNNICCMLCRIFQKKKQKKKQKNYKHTALSGPGCSKLTTSLVNVPLNFHTPIFVAEKNMSKSCSYLFNKYVSVFGC